MGEQGWRNIIVLENKSSTTTTVVQQSTVITHVPCFDPEAFSCTKKVFFGRTARDPHSTPSFELILEAWHVRRTIKVLPPKGFRCTPSKTEGRQAFIVKGMYKYDYS